MAPQDKEYRITKFDNNLIVIEQYSELLETWFPVNGEYFNPEKVTEEFLKERLKKLIDLRENQKEKTITVLFTEDDLKKEK